MQELLNRCLFAFDRIGIINNSPFIWALKGQKVTNDDEGEGRGQDTPRFDGVIYEQPHISITQGMLYEDYLSITLIF